MCNIDFDFEDFWAQKLSNSYAYDDFDNPYRTVSNAIDDYADSWDFYQGNISPREMRKEVKSWNLSKDEIIFAINYCNQLSGVKHINRLIDVLSHM